MAAAVSAEGETFNVGARRAAVSGPAARYRQASLYQVAPDGNRFLFNMAPDAQLTQTPITVVVNWTAGLKK